MSTVLKLACAKSVSPTVAVVIICYKQSQYLEDSIRSVRSQTRKPDELIVVCGDEDSISEAIRLGVDYIVDDRKGHANARNLGVGSIRSSHFIPLDADDRLAPTFIERTMDALPKDRRLSIVGTSLREFGLRDGYWDPSPFQNIREENCLCVASLVSKELWDLIGGYSVALLGYEDWDFWLRCWKLNAGVVQLKDRLLEYRIHNESSTSKTGHWHQLMCSMMRITHPDVYTVDRIVKDYSIVGAMPDDALVRLEQKIWYFPKHNVINYFYGIVKQCRGQHNEAKVSFLE